MDPLEYDLAQKALDLLNRDHGLSEYIRVTLGEADFSALPLGNLFVEIDNYFNRAATLKSMSNFLTRDIGVNKSRCILIVAIEDDDLYNLVARVITEETEGYYLARAKTIKEADGLVSYFGLEEQNCGLITFYQFSDGQNCIPVVKRCKDLPVVVLLKNEPTGVYVKLLAEGANSILDLTFNLFEKRFLQALSDSFME